VTVSTIFLIAIGGTLAIEGALWAIFPRQFKDMYRQMMSMPDRTLHMAGLMSVAIGVALLVWGVKLSAL